MSLGPHRVRSAPSIRLLPHYAFGVFFVLAHLATGLRQVLLVHRMRETMVNRIWKLGVVAGGAVAATIVGALVGVRV